MALAYINDEHLSDIADAIREKNGSNTLYYPSEMAGAILAIVGGGGANGPFIYSRGTYFGSSTNTDITSLNITIDANIGSKVILIIMHTYNISLSDNTFSLVKTIQVENYSQCISIYEKNIASVSDIGTVTVTQESAARMCAYTFYTSNENEHQDSDDLDGGLFTEWDNDHEIISGGLFTDWQEG